MYLAKLNTVLSGYVLRKKVGLRVQHVVKLERVQVQLVTGNTFRRVNVPRVVQPTPKGQTGG